jgi:hypothetical protein
MTKALIVAPSWIGDTIMAQPLFVRLHARHPDLQLDALAPSLGRPGPAAHGRNPEVVDSPFGHGQLSLQKRWRLARELAGRNYDAVYVLPNSLKSALLPFMAGIPKRIGFTGESRVGLINVRHTLDKAALPLMVERFAQLAETPGRPCPGPFHTQKSGRPQPTRQGRWPNSALSARRASPPSAPAPNTARPSAGRRGTSPPWHSNWPRPATPSGCSGLPRTTPSPKKSRSSPPASAATCAAPPRSARPSTCWRSPTLSSATTPGLCMSPPR